MHNARINTCPAVKYLTKIPISDKLKKGKGDFMKKRMFRFLAVFLTIFLLAGCAGTPVAPSEDSTVPLPTEPDELVFNGISYPLDVESLDIGPYHLEQLRWATKLNYLMITGREPDSWEFLGELPDTLCTLYLNITPGSGDSGDLNLELSEYFLPELEQFILGVSRAAGAVTLPDMAAEWGTVELSQGVKQLDASTAEIKNLVLALSETPEKLKLGPGLKCLACEGFVLDTAALEGQTELISLTLSAAQDLSFLADLPALEMLSLSGDGWDLTPAAQTNLRRVLLLKGSCDLSPLVNSGVEEVATQGADTEAIASLAGMQSLKSLQVSDEKVTDLSVLTELPNLETLILLVDEMQTHAEMAERTLTADSVDALERLDTGLPKEQLAAFLERGGTISILPDYGR